jgi:imidazoleglycerol phosphate synthase glutamine amidotransferase subunit HisH
MYANIRLLKNKISVASMKKNIFGVQFHPEKSGIDGIKFLGAFCSFRN